MARMTAAVGMGAIALYQLLYTWPRRKELILDIMEANGVLFSSAVWPHIVFGGEPAAPICISLLLTGMLRPCMLLHAVWQKCCCEFYGR